MESLASGALMVIALVAFANYRAGTLPTWLKSKFLNSGAPSSEPGAFDAASSSSAALNGAAFATGTTGFVTPVQGTITDPYGAARPAGGKHQGEDIAVPQGTPIKAATGGKVTYSGQSAGYGNRIDIDQGNGIVTRYGHLSSLDVKVGDVVGVGQYIGLSGGQPGTPGAGDATGPHLHFEIRKNGDPVDPGPYINYGLAGKRAVSA